jgi:hypothetical protein
MFSAVLPRRASGGLTSLTYTN